MAAEAEAESQYFHVLSAFLAMEPVDSVITLARWTTVKLAGAAVSFCVAFAPAFDFDFVCPLCRECNGGSITDSAQRFFWEICVKAVSKLYSSALLGNENSEKFGSFMILVVESLIWDLLVFAKLCFSLENFESWVVVVMCNLL